MLFNKKQNHSHENAHIFRSTSQLQNVQRSENPFFHKEKWGKIHLKLNHSQAIKTIASDNEMSNAFYSSLIEANLNSKRWTTFNPDIVGGSQTIAEARLCGTVQIHGIRINDE